MAEQPTDTLHIRITARIDNEPAKVHEEHVPISPEYVQEDIDALTVHEVENAAHAFNLKFYKRRPTRESLIGLAAYYRAVKEASDDAPASPLRQRIREILAKSLAEITAEYGEQPNADQDPDNE